MTSLLGETAISTAAHKHAAVHQPKPEGILRLSLRSPATPSHLRRRPLARIRHADAGIGREVTALAELGIRSMDTSLPLHMAYLEQAMVTASTGVPRSPDYFDGRWNEGRRILGASNVDTFQHWAQA